QLADSVTMFGGNGKDSLDAEATKILGHGFELRSIYFVHDQQHRLAAANEQSREVNVRCGQLSAAVHHHSDNCRFFESNSRLSVNLCGDRLCIIGKDAAGIDNLNLTPIPMRLPIETVSRDARFITDNGAPIANQAIEERALA